MPRHKTIKHYWKVEINMPKVPPAQIIPDAKEVL